MAPARIWGPLAARVRPPTAGRHKEDGNQVVHSFLRALLTLSASLVAALYANSSARDGRVLASSIAAFVAMGIAVWVAVRLVPKLAAGVDWQWLPVFTQYKITREGTIYLAATLVVAMAALNTSNNLLYMVLAAMLAVLVLSGFLSSLNFKSLDAQARMPDRCYAGQPFMLSVGVRSRKRVFPTLSLEIAPGEGSPFRFDPYYVSLVRAGTLETETGTATLPVRGRWKAGKFILRSRYPFGFIAKGRPFDVETEIVAYPELLPTDSVRLTLPDMLGTAERLDRGNGMDLYGIREYLSTDSARHVDWKASARTADLKTREYAAEESRRIRIEFDRCAGREEAQAFERLVSEAASTAVHLVREGMEVTLASDEWISPAIRSEGQMEEILLYLAEVKASPDGSPPAGDGSIEAIRFSLRRPERRPASGVADREIA